MATVKVSLDKLQSPWRRSPTQAAMAVDSDGVVILASEPGWKYRTLEPLPRATLDRVKATRQFENVPLEPLGHSDGARARRRRADHLAARTAMAGNATDSCSRSGCSPLRTGG